jgi:hypothetical protein
MKEKLIELISKTKFEYNPVINTDDIKNNGHKIIQTGIGDILIIMSLVKQTVLKNPVYINIHIFIENCYGINNYLENFTFKLLLLDKICQPSEVIFYHDTKISYSNWTRNMKKLNFDIIKPFFDLTYTAVNEEYIVIHTKCRFHGGVDNNKVKESIKPYFENFKTKYTIVILGEKTVATNYQTTLHNMNTIYNEVIVLKNNNNVIDLTVDDIYDNLSFENYCKDVSIIHNAKTNILIGNGGQYCNSLFFGKSLIAYTYPILIENLDLNSCNQHNFFYYYELDDFFKNISEVLSH